MRWKRAGHGRYRAVTADGVRYDVMHRWGMGHWHWIALAARLVVCEPGTRKAQRWTTMREAKAACEAIEAGTVVR